MYATGLNGLGLVVTTTSRFDPARMKARLIYWLDQAANEMGENARKEINASGGEASEGDKNTFRNAAIAQGMVGAGTWSSSVAMPKAPSAVATYGKMAAQLAVGFVMPWVGIAWAISGFLGKKKKPKMPIPWNAIYASALPYAQQATQQEELQRIAEEAERIKQERYTEITKVSAKAAIFQLPEGVTSITKGGALVIQPRGMPVERRK
jgi:hypothetical protein